VDRAVYRGLEMRDLQTSYLLKQGILQVDDLDIRTAGGKLVGSGRIDLRGTEPEFSGVLEVSSLQASELASLLSERLGDRLAGDLNGSIRFSGSGTNWPRIRKGLSIYAEYDILQGQIREFPVTAAIAELLQLSELRSFSFEKFAGNLRVEQGQVLLKSDLTGPDLRAETLGTISLEGLMNLPVTLHLSGRLAERIRNVTHLTRYLIAAEEGFRVDLRLTGPITDPRSELDLGAAGKRLREGLEEKFKRQIERFLKEEPTPENAPEQPESESPPARDLLDKLFSR
jgi:hypothetical protein